MKLIYFKHNKGAYMPEMLPMKIAFSELTLLLHGNADYTFDGKRFTLESGDVLFARENSIRSRSELNGCDYVSFNFIYEEGETEPDFPLPMRGALTNEIELLLSACDEIHARTVGDDDKERLLLIVRCILLQLEANGNTPECSVITRRMKQYVRAHIAEKITLEEIARASLYSPVYCAAVFKRETGSSVIDYVIDEKIKEAKSLILQGMRLSEVAELVGIADYNYFSRVFKKRVGYTPSRYRKYTQANEKDG